MTPRETAAFNAGIEAARQMAMVAAVTIEVRDDAGEIRQRAAAAALSGFAEGMEALKLGKSPNPSAAAFEAISATPGAAGTTECPACAGRLRWARDSHNGHIHMACETVDCLRVMQ